MTNTSDKSRRPMVNDVIIQTAELANISGESSGPKATDELDIADNFSAISMTEENQRRIVEKLEIF